MSTLAHTVTREVVLDAPPERVWEALTDDAALSEWLAPEVELDPREGGEVVCRFEDGEERRGEVELVEEAERLAFHWWRDAEAPSRVEFTLAPATPGTRLTVTETRPALLAGRRDDFGGISAEIVPSAAWEPALASLRVVVGRLVLA